MPSHWQTARGISGTSSPCFQSCQVLRRLAFSDWVPNRSKRTRIVLVCSYKRSYKPFHEKHDEADSSTNAEDDKHTPMSLSPSWSPRSPLTCSSFLLKTLFKAVHVALVAQLYDSLTQLFSVRRIFGYSAANAITHLAKQATDGRQSATGTSSTASWWQSWGWKTFRRTTVAVGDITVGNRGLPCQILNASKCCLLEKKTFQLWERQLSLRCMLKWWSKFLRTTKQLRWLFHKPALDASCPPSVQRSTQNMSTVS